MDIKEQVIEKCLEKGYKRSNILNTKKVYFTTPDNQQIKIDFEKNLVSWLSEKGIVTSTQEVTSLLK